MPPPLWGVLQLAGLELDFQKDHTPGAAQRRPDISDPALNVPSFNDLFPSVPVSTRKPEIVVPGEPRYDPGVLGMSPP